MWAKEYTVPLDDASTVRYNGTVDVVFFGVCVFRWRTRLRYGSNGTVDVDVEVVFWYVCVPCSSSVGGRVYGTVVTVLWMWMWCFGVGVWVPLDDASTVLTVLTVLWMWRVLVCVCVSCSRPYASPSFVCVYGYG